MKALEAALFVAKGEKVSAEEDLARSMKNLREEAARCEDRIASGKFCGPDKERIAVLVQRVGETFAEVLTKKEILEVLERLGGKS